MAKARTDARVTLRFTPTPDERERILQARLDRVGGRVARVFPLLVITPAVVVLALLGARLAGGGAVSRVETGMAAATLLIALPMLLFSVPALRRRTLFRRTGEETVALGGGGVAWTPAVGVPVELGWAELTAVEERLGVVLFVPRQGVAIAVPRRALEGLAGERVREIARRHLGERARI